MFKTSETARKLIHDFGLKIPVQKSVMPVVPPSVLETFGKLSREIDRSGWGDLATKYATTFARGTAGFGAHSALMSQIAQSSEFGRKVGLSIGKVDTGTWGQVRVNTMPLAAALTVLQPSLAWSSPTAPRSSLQITSVSLEATDAEDHQDGRLAALIQTIKHTVDMPAEVFIRDLGGCMAFFVVVLGPQADPSVVVLASLLFYVWLLILRSEDSD